MRKMDMVTRYQMRVSVYMLCVLLCALTAKGIKLGTWVYAGCPADREYVYIQHTGRTEAIDARIWPFHVRNPSTHAVNLE
jgi:hypothetical protein